MILLLIQLLINHPKKLLGVALGITLILAYFVPRVELKSSAEQFYPSKKDANRQFYDRMQSYFGDEAGIIVAVISPTIFQPDTLRKVRDLTVEIQNLAKVERVDSLATAQRILSSKEDIRSEDYLHEIPVSSEELKKLQHDILNDSIYSKSLISEDATMTTLRVIFSKSDAQDRKNIALAVRRLVDEYNGPEKIFITGSTELNLTVTDILRTELKRFALPIVGIMLLVLFFTFRSVLSFALPLISSALGILWTFGIMGLFEIPLTILSSSLPPILVAVGCSYAIYILSAYYYMHSDAEDHEHHLGQVLRRTLLAVILCAGTTALGFFGLWLNEILLVEQMGLTSMVGIMCLLFMTTFVLPCLFSVMGAARLMPLQGKVKPVKVRPLKRWEQIPLLYRGNAKWWILATYFSVAIIIIYFIPQLRIETDPLSFFRAGSDVRQNIMQLVHKMQSGYDFRLIIEAKKKDYFKEPAVLNLLSELQTKIALLPGVGQTISLADYVKTANKSFNENKPDFSRIPDTREEIAQYLFLYSLAGGEESLFRMVKEDYDLTHIIVNSSITNSNKLFSTAEIAEQQCYRMFRAAVNCQATGYYIITAQSAKNLSYGVLKGFSVALVVIFVMMMLMFRSFKIGCIAMIPNLLPVLLLLGFMGATGIPFNIGTCMTVGLALAMAVDDTIHFFVHYYQELKRTNHFLIRSQTGVKKTDEQWLSMVHTWRHLCRPMMTTTLTVIAGFLILMFSDLLPISYLGLLMAIAMLLALLSDLVLSPILIVSIEI